VSFFILRFSKPFASMKNDMGKRGVPVDDFCILAEPVAWESKAGD
jgi:hypothetical protein